MQKRLLWLIINNLTKTLNDLGNFFMSKTLIEHCQSISLADIQLSGVDLLSVEINHQLVKVSLTTCNYGGERAWFVCPKCFQRVGKLFRKPLAQQFFCRRCNDLAYLSTRIRRSLIESDIKVMRHIISQSELPKFQI